jgi:hypothetical protein
MNTTSKGDVFEEKVSGIFRELISKGEFYALPELCHLHRKKGYYSKDREKEIIFDISIEVFLPGSKEISLLIIVECKNYNHKVPVNDAEEFFAKLHSKGDNQPIVLVS